MADPFLRRPGDGPTPFGRLLSSMKRPASDPAPFPGELGDRGLRYRLWALNDQELIEARASGLAFLQKYFKSLDKDTPPELFLAADSNFFDEEFERQVLSRALRDPTNPDSPLADVAELRIALGPDERRILMAAYTDFLDERTPLKHIKSEQEMKELVAALGEEQGSSVSMSAYDGVSQRRIIYELASWCRQLIKQHSLGT